MQKSSLENNNTMMKITDNIDVFFDSSLDYALPNSFWDLFSGILN